VTGSRRALVTRRQFGWGLGVGIAAMAVSGRAKVAARKPPYKDARLPIAERVADLLARMTLEEKVMQMQCLWQGLIKVEDENGAFIAAKADALLPHSLGMVGRPGERQGRPLLPSGMKQANRTPLETARYVNAWQRWAMERTRLGIPLLFHEEALHGYAARHATCFPQAIALASSFDPEMVERVFAVAAQEMRARGAQLALAPVVDVARDPRWGRIEETYGEDTWLAAEMGQAAVRGLQGVAMPLARDKVFATLKHMAGHGLPESGTNTAPAGVAERTLRTDFLPPFERAIRRAGAAAVMPSYNEIDGIPSHANSWLLKRVLREEWGFPGLVISDYGGITRMIDQHRLAKDVKEAALIAIEAGVDVETPDPVAYGELASLVREGRVTIAQIDASVSRLLTMKFAAGLFEQPYADVEAANRLTATPGAIALARAAAGRSAVLLKNSDNTLPLKASSVGRLLVVGTHARETPIGGYSDQPKKVVSVLEAIQAEGAVGGFEVAYSEGVRLTQSRGWHADKIEFIDPAVNAQLIADAVKAATSADTIVMVLGDNEQTSREAYSSTHLGDRLSLDLIGQQNDLAAAILAMGKPTIVFLLNGRPLSINLLHERAAAIVEGWYLGQETGNAAADILFGRVNPGGKLPVSIPRDVGQVPIHYSRKQSARRGYIDGTTIPLYPFGHGLSYTQFEISAPRLSAATIRADQQVDVTVTVRNTGEVAGDEVVQLYIRDDVSSVTRPVMELKGFKRVAVAPKESVEVRFAIGPEHLQLIDTKMKAVVEPGTFTIYTGPNSIVLKSVTLTVV